MQADVQKDQIAEALCGLIRAALPAARQTVKWNAPNFEIEGRDLITLNFPPKGGVRVVFHQGAQAKDSKTGARLVPDTSGRLTWATDQRAYAAFPELQAVQDGAAWLTAFCQSWARASGAPSS